MSTVLVMNERTLLRRLACGDVADVGFGDICGLADSLAALSAGHLLLVSRYWAKHTRRNGGATHALRLLDQLDPVSVGVFYEAEP